MKSSKFTTALTRFSPIALTRFSPIALAVSLALTAGCEMTDGDIADEELESTQQSLMENPSTVFECAASSFTYHDLPGTSDGINCKHAVMLEEANDARWNEYCDLTIGPGSEKTSVKVTCDPNQFWDPVGQTGYIKADLCCSIP